MAFVDEVISIVKEGDDFLLDDLAVLPAVDFFAESPAFGVVGVGDVVALGGGGSVVAFGSCSNEFVLGVPTVVPESGVLAVSGGIVGEGFADRWYPDGSAFLGLGIRIGSGVALAGEDGEGIPWHPAAGHTRRCDGITISSGEAGDLSGSGGADPHPDAGGGMGGDLEGFVLPVGPAEGLVEQTAGVGAVFRAAADTVELIAEATERGMAR